MAITFPRWINVVYAPTKPTANSNRTFGWIRSLLGELQKQAENEGAEEVDSERALGEYEANPPSAK